MEKLKHIFFTNEKGRKNNVNEQTKSSYEQIYSIVHTFMNERERHSSIILNHFYFQFNPIYDYSIESVFNIFPLKSGIIEDEIISPESFLSIVLNKPVFSLTPNDYVGLKLPIRFLNSNTKLKECTSGVWRFIAYKDEIKLGDNMTVEDLQKKIIPWQSIMPNHEDLKEETRTNSTLILVASLIDKQTNLGNFSYYFLIIKIINLENVKIISIKKINKLYFFLVQVVFVAHAKYSTSKS